MKKATSDEALVQQVMEEAARNPSYRIQLQLDLFALTAVIGHLQLALRHVTGGASAQAVRQFIDKSIGRVAADGLPRAAELLRAGDDPERDRRPDPASDRGPFS